MKEKNLAKETKKMEGAGIPDYCEPGIPEETPGRNIPNPTDWVDENGVKIADKKGFFKRIAELQASIKAPKSQYNDFGKYHYRSNEDILEALKPFLRSLGLIVIQTDEIVEVAGRIYVKATSIIRDTENPMLKIENSAFAREPEAKKGMDEMQITGAASSYARKYSLSGLLGLDDNKDADNYNKDGNSQNQKPQSKPQSKQKDKVLNLADIKKTVTTLGLKIVEKTIKGKKYWILDGNVYEKRESIKSLGFKFSSNRKEWYLEIPSKSEAA